jgi:hypothetical protein
MMDYFHVFVLTSLSLDNNDDVRSRNLAVTFDLFEAEDQKTRAWRTTSRNLRFLPSGVRMQNNQS